jgi:mannose-6-phosphate isomerase-like protein (cupin superfamily)
MQIQFHDQVVDLSPGEMCVVPAGVEHKPLSETDCEILLIEPAGTINTGDAGGERTKLEETWI